MTALHELSAAEVVAKIAQQEFSAQELVAALLERIEQTDARLQAWVTLDRSAALQAAGELDARAVRGERLPLQGLPFGVKDIIDVAGLPTAAGFPPFHDRTATQDAAIVARLRALGSIPLGKTHTTQFAFSDPAPTANPYDLSRTPGGSSSGSGAAVGARMVPLALGTQTAGSVLRPAAYCGAVGFKPTYNWFSRDGVLPLAWSLDHLGVIVRRAGDAALLFDALLGVEPTPIERRMAPRIGLLVEFLERSEPAVATHLEDVATRLEQSGARVTRLRLPLDLDLLLAVHHVIMQVEVAAVHAEQVGRLRNAYGPAIPADVDVGQLVPAVYDIKARRLRGSLGQAVDDLFASYDALLLPTASNFPPAKALKSTGDRTFQAPWTLLGTPAISLPTGLSADRLPIGAQLIGRRGADRELLALAAWAEANLGLIEPPDLACSNHSDRALHGGA